MREIWPRSRLGHHAGEDAAQRVGWRSAHDRSRTYDARPARRLESCHVPTVHLFEIGQLVLEHYAIRAEPISDRVRQRLQTPTE